MIINRIALILVLGGAAGLFSQANTGSISGRVIDIVTDSPVDGVKVGSRETGYVMTDSDGRYRLSGINPGPAEIGIEDHGGGYIDMTLTGSRKVTVSGGQDLSGIDFRVRLDGSISGRVIDDDGNPVSGARVAAITREYNADEVSYSTARTATTDDRGRYTFNSGIFAGRPYRVLAYNPVEIPSPVSDAPGDPQSRRRTLPATYYPDANLFNSALPVVLHSLEHRENVDIRMPRSASYCLEATLKAGGGPAKMRFAVADEEIYRLGSPFQGSFTSRNGESGNDGKIRVCDLYPGQFQLVAFVPPANMSNAAASRAPAEYMGAVPVTITDRDAKDVVLSAVPPSTISGEVVWDSTPYAGTLPSRLGLVGFTAFGVQPISLPGEFSFSIPASYTTFRNRYPLRLVGVSRPLYVKDITYAGSSILNKTFVPSDNGGKLRVTLAHDSGSIAARVADANGQPVARSMVLILAANAQSESELSATMLAGIADDNGLFVANGVPPGKYFAVAVLNPPPSRYLRSEEISIDRTPETMSLLLRTRSLGQQLDLAPNAMVQVSLMPKTLQ